MSKGDDDDAGLWPPHVNISDEDRKLFFTLFVIGLGVVAFAFMMLILILYNWFLS